MSGLECNIEKSALMQIGDLEPLPLEIINEGFPLVDNLKILGTTIKGNCDDFDENFKNIDVKVQKQINLWSRFNLSLTGRISIAKTMLYSQLNYNGCFLPLNEDSLLKIENKIVKFVTGKCSIARERVFKSVNEGGLGIFPVLEFLGAQQCSWILTH
jgi:hypothetical protein